MYLVGFIIRKLRDKYIRCLVTCPVVTERSSSTAVSVEHGYSKFIFIFVAIHKNNRFRVSYRITSVTGGNQVFGVVQS